jgi:hypothetical protein
MCVSRKELCVYGSRVACKLCQQRKVRCSFLDWKRKRQNEEIDSEEDEEPTPKKPRTGGSKPSGSKPMVEISGSALSSNNSPVSEMVGLLRELVEGVRELTKVTRGVAGLGVQIHQQNAKLIRLGERQSYLAEKMTRKGVSGSGSSSDAEGSGLRRDKGKGKMTEGIDETMKSDGDSGSEEEDRDMRLDEDGVSGTDEDTEK